MKLNPKLQAQLDRNTAPLTPADLDQARQLAGHHLPEDYRAFMLGYGPLSFREDGTEFRYEYRDADGVDAVEWNSLAELYHPDAIKRMVQQLRGFYHGDVLDRMLPIGATPNGDPIFMGVRDQAGIWIPIGHDGEGPGTPKPVAP
jgi:hypothetical protein